MRLFFVDFENVASGGMNDVSKISKDDKVFLFYTSNSNKMEFKLYKELIKVDEQIQLFEVSSGNNSLDFQLSSFLGSLIPDNKTAEFIIVSKDKGFSSVVDFWTKRNVIICQVNNMNMQDNKSLMKELSEKLPDYKDDLPDIVDMLAKYKTKQGLSNALTNKYDNPKGSAIYKVVKSYIK